MPEFSINLQHYW